MEPQDYINRAQASLRDNNTVGALTILEEGYAKFRSPELLAMIEQARSRLNHLKDRKNYLDFYERQQRKPDKYYSFGRRLERRIRGLFGAKTKRLVENCAKNPRYIKAETDIREGGYRHILDIGCWEGHFAIGLGARNPLLQVTGVEIASTNVEIARELNRFKSVRFVQGFAEDVNRLFQPDSFDFVMLFEILEHVISVEEVISAALEVTKPGGKFVITVPATAEEDDHDEHVRFFSDNLIQDLFGNRPDFMVEKIPHPPRPGHAQEYSNYISFTKPVGG